MFVDEVKVYLKAGDGGNGCVSFYRGKFLPKGGPNGGDGGKGGDFILRCDENVGDLSAYCFKPEARAQNGEPGRGKDQFGAGGQDFIMLLPPGTVVIDESNDIKVAELTTHGQEVILLQGGKGGKGNLNFKSSTNQAPVQFTEGVKGEEGSFRLVLKTIADIGLVGFPNAGKSSLLNAITKATPKMAPYPFTTLHPHVGVIDYPELYDRIWIADVPGLIEGASENRGLGHRFLKHIERCAILLFMIDMAGQDGREPWKDYKQLVDELSLYDKSLLEKKSIIVANKMDIPEAVDNLAIFKKHIKELIIPISCLEKEGLDTLKKKLYEIVRSIKT